MTPKPPPGFALIEDDPQQAAVPTPPPGFVLMGEQKPQAEIRSYEPTWREKIGGFISDMLGNSVEGDRVAQGVVGSSGLGHSSLSVSDFTPARIPMYGQEAKRAYEQGRTGDAALDALGAVPVPVLNKAVETAGTLAEPALGALGNVGTQLAARLPQRVTGRSADDVANRVLSERLQRSGQSADTVAADLAAGERSARLDSNSNATLPEMIADTSDDMQRLTGSVYRTGGEAGEIVKPAFEMRQRGPANPYAPRLEDGPQGQIERIVDDFDRALGVKSSKGARATSKELEAAQKAKADDLFERARNNSEEFDLTPALTAARMEAQQIPGEIGDTLHKAINLFDPNARVGSDIREAARRQLRQADDMLAAKMRDGKELTERDLQARANLEENVTANLEKALDAQAKTSRLGVTDVRRFDNAKKALDQMIENSFGEFDKPTPLTRQLVKFKNDLIAQVELNGKNKFYRQAREEFGSAAENREAIELGRRAFREDSEVSVETYRSLTPAQQKLFRIGLRDALRLALATKKPGDNATLLLQQRRVRELLQEVIPMPRGRAAEFADRPQRFGDLMRREERMSQTRNAVLGNSATAQRQADDAQFSADAISKVLASGRNVTNMALEVIAGGLQRVFGYRQDVAAALARRLVETDPASRAAILSDIRAQHGPRAFSEFSEGISGPLSARGLASSPAALTTDQRQDEVISGGGGLDRIGGGPEQDTLQASDDPGDRVPITGDAAKDAQIREEMRQNAERNTQQAKDRSLVRNGDQVLIPNNLQDAADMALKGLSNAGEVAAAFGPMGGLLDELAGAASLAAKGRGVVKGAQEAPSALDGVFDDVRASKAARAAESKASHGRSIQTQAAEQGSTGTVPIARGTRNADAQRDAEHLRSGLPEGTSPMPIKGRQGMPTRDEQFDLVDKYLSGGGRLDDIPEGPWGRNAVDDAREAIQRQWNKDNPPALPAKAASTGPEANKPAVPEIVRAWKEAKSQVAQLQARLKQLESAPAPRRPYKIAGLDDPPRSPYSMLSPDEALSRLNDPSAVRAELRQVQEDVVKLQKIVRDAGVDLGDVAKDITPRAPPSAYRRGPE